MGAVVVVRVTDDVSHFAIWNISYENNHYDCDMRPRFTIDVWIVAK